MLFDLLNIRPDDRRPFICSAGWFATVLSTLYILRPIRDALGSMKGASRLPYFFVYVFLTMLVVVPLYAWLVSRYERRKLVPVVYRVLTLSLLGFSLAMRLPEETVGAWVAPVFFVWVSVSNMFLTSVFWSVQADVFSKERGKSLFGPISACGTVAAIGASLIMGAFVESVGPASMLLVPVLLLETGLYCFRQLDRVSTAVNRVAEERRSANPFDGFLQVVRSPYLFMILLYTFSTTLCSTTLYLQQAELLNARWPDSAARAAVFARIDLSVHVLTVLFQLLIAAPLTRFSVGLAMCALPAAFAAGYGGLSLTMSGEPDIALWILIGTMILSRSSVYGLSVPAIGVLYTVVSRDEKYKAKNIIDTLVIRGGDAFTGWTVTALRSLGMATPMLFGLMVPIALSSMGLGILLGRKNSQARAEVAEQPA